MGTQCAIIGVMNRKDARRHVHPTALSTVPHYRANHGAWTYACNRSIHHRD